MLPHHEAAAAAGMERIKSEGPVDAVLIGGSIARGVERPDSDVDLIAVIGDDAWEQRHKHGTVSFLWRDLADWEGGYVEGRYVSHSFIDQAAERGSEPTRHSFIGVRPLWTADPTLEERIRRIPIYPEAERQYRIDAFMAQMQLNRWYFFPEGLRRNDPYMRSRAASEIVLFAGRLILAHNRILFPCQRRLMEYVAAAPENPAAFIDDANAFTEEQTKDRMEALCEMILAFTDWNIQSDLLSSYERDVEMSWFTRTIAVAEW